MREKLQIGEFELKPVYPSIWRIEPRGKMRVGVNLVGNTDLLLQAGRDRSITQATNVASLPGVVDPVLTMPDIHQGYGFPIGGVAAFRADSGVVSPGGVGYDINCGVRILKTSIMRERVQNREVMRRLVSNLFDKIPCGVGSRRADLSLNREEMDLILTRGARWAVEHGFGTQQDISFLEENGCISSADPETVSVRATERGSCQLGTLGSGNHFVEVQYVDEVLDRETAEVFGLTKDQVVISIHTGSRGLGYQVCADYLEQTLAVSAKYGIDLVDRELASVPIHSREGQKYLGAMACAANFAFANRQIITHWVREVFNKQFGDRKLEVIYDVCHNIAKFEELAVRSGTLKVCVHRKGATRAYPPHHSEIPTRYRPVGQPILIPGDMGRFSYVLVGKKGAMERSLGSACHGAGRQLSRTQAKKLGKGRALVRELEDQGIYVKAYGRNTVLEEMPEAYKSVTAVVEATQEAEIAGVVCRLRPIGVIKG